MSEKPNDRRWFAFLSPLWDSHPVGLLIATLAFVAMADCGVGATLILGSLGFRWQTYVMLYSPFVCAVGCLTVFIAVPEGNHSHYRVIYGI